MDILGGFRAVLRCAKEVQEMQKNPGAGSQAPAVHA